MAFPVKRHIKSDGAFWIDSELGSHSKRDDGLLPLCGKSVGRHLDPAFHRELPIFEPETERISVTLLACFTRCRGLKLFAGLGDLVGAVGGHHQKLASVELSCLTEF